MRYKLYFSPAIIEAKDLEEVNRRIDDGELFDTIVLDVVEIVEKGSDIHETQ